MGIYDYMKFWIAKDIAEFVGTALVLTIVFAVYGIAVLVQSRRDHRKRLRQEVTDG